VDGLQVGPTRRLLSFFSREFGYSEIRGFSRLPSLRRKLAMSLLGFHLWTSWPHLTIVKFRMSLRQESLGREEEPRTRKPFVGTLRVTNPAWQSRASSQKRVLRGGGRPSLRSVDSQIRGRVIEPRKFQTWGAFVVDMSGGRVVHVTIGPEARE
jgi:hypothetical protein